MLVWSLCLQDTAGRFKPPVFPSFRQDNDELYKPLLQSSIFLSLSIPRLGGQPWTRKRETVIYLICNLFLGLAHMSNSISIRYVHKALTEHRVVLKSRWWIIHFISLLKWLFGGIPNFQTNPVELYSLGSWRLVMSCNFPLWDRFRRLNIFCRKSLRIRGVQVVPTNVWKQLYNGGWMG